MLRGRGTILSPRVNVDSSKLTMEILFPSRYHFSHGYERSPNQYGMKGNQGRLVRGLLEKVFLSDKKTQRRRNKLPAFRCICVTFWASYLASKRQERVEADDERAERRSSSS